MKMLDKVNAKVPRSLILSLKLIISINLLSDLSSNFRMGLHGGDSEVLLRIQHLLIRKEPRENVCLFISQYL